VADPPRVVGDGPDDVGQIQRSGATRRASRKSSQSEGLKVWSRRANCSTLHTVSTASLAARIAAS
jgi:hypothetical protein